MSFAYAIAGARGSNSWHADPRAVGGTGLWIASRSLRALWRYQPMPAVQGASASPTRPASRITLRSREMVALKYTCQSQAIIYNGKYRVRHDSQDSVDQSPQSRLPTAATREKLGVLDQHLAKSRSPDEARVLYSWRTGTIWRAKESGSTGASTPLSQPDVQEISTRTLGSPLTTARTAAILDGSA